MNGMINVTAQSQPKRHETLAASGLRLALITPARNEEQFIELTLRSVIAQNVRPIRWIIVNDGSTDRTGEIVARYAMEHDWMEYVALPARAGRSRRTWRRAIR